MEVEHREPGYVDKGEVDENKLVKLYSHLGAYINRNNIPSKEIEDLEDAYGDISQELLYMKEENLAYLVGENNLRVVLAENERGLAEKIYRMSLQNMAPEEIVHDHQSIPSYITSPGSFEEEFNTETDLTHEPPEEVIGRVVNALPEKEAVEPGSIEGSMDVEIGSGIEFWLDYLETQDVVEKESSERVKLVDSEEVNRLLEESSEKYSESLKQQQRFRNDPWKP